MRVIGWQLGLWCLIMLSCVILANDVSPGSADQASSESNDELKATGDSGDSAYTAESHGALIMYRRLLKHKRAAHMDAVMKIAGLNSIDKQNKMLKAIFSKLFDILSEARVRLTQYSFVPTDPFPTDVAIADAFSTILENTAFLGDIVLRLPDMSHSLLDSNSAWKTVMQWAVQFTNDSHVFVDQDSLVIKLMAQELELVEKEPNFVNPFKQETKVEKIVDEELQKILLEQKRKLQRQEKKDKKKKLKGPRMSSRMHAEL